MKHFRRVAERLLCDIPVNVHLGTLKRQGRLVDLTPFGAQVQMAVPYAESAIVEVAVRGQRVEATVMWRQSDRMGIRFAETIVDGPLRKRIESLNQSAYGNAQLPGMRQLDQ